MKHTVYAIGAMLFLSCGRLSAQSASTVPQTVEIPAGTFYMGSTDLAVIKDEAPVHKVVISQPFRMGVTEVTNAQYEAFRPEHKQLRGKNNVSTEDDDAVVNVSWQYAVDYCEWLSRQTGKTYRLPTEAEWEYACRAGTYTRYYFGDGLPASCCRNQVIARDFKAVSLRVGQTPANGFGLYDMHGNVEEWCSDWYAPYKDGEQTDPAGPADGEFKVTRGGSHHTPTDYLRSATRLAMIPEDMHSQTGFRVVESDFTPKPFTVDMNEPFFLEPLVFVKPPIDPAVPFYGHNHQPAVTWCDNGDILAAWFSANAENNREMVVLQSRLRKGSDEWSPATLLYKVPGRNMTGTALFNNGKGKLFHLNGVEASGDWQNLMMVQRTSTDNGLTWTKARIIAPEHTKRHQVIQGTTQTPEGWMIQLCDAGPESHDGAAIHISRDGGETWYDPWDGVVKKEFAEGETGTTIAGIHAGVVCLKNGDLMALGRGNGIVKDGKKMMPMSISKDMGKTWTYSASPFTMIDGGQRLVLLRLNEGPIVLISFTDHPQRTPVEHRGMTFKDKDGSEYVGYGMFAAVSYDEGRTWPVRRLLTDGKERLLNGGAWTANFLMDKTHAEPRGYLAGTQSPDGTIHIVSSRLHYRFNLKWLEE